MDGGLEVYHRPYDARFPLCFDETSKQLVDHARQPIRPCTGPGPARVDDELERCCTAHIFLAVEPLTRACSFVHIRPRNANSRLARATARGTWRLTSRQASASGGALGGRHVALRENVVAQRQDRLGGARKTDGGIDFPVKTPRKGLSWNPGTAPEAR